MMKAAVSLMLPRPPESSASHRSRESPGLDVCFRDKTREYQVTHWQPPWTHAEDHCSIVGFFAVFFSSVLYSDATF